MHVELADLFRCPVPHDDSWLVVAAELTRDRVVLEGELGCPVCGAGYPIREGVTHFDAPVDAVAPSSSGALDVADAYRDASAADASAADARAVDAGAVDAGAVDAGAIADASTVGPDGALRLAALLNLNDPSLTVALLGCPPARATALQRIVPARVIIVNARRGEPTEAVYRDAAGPLAIIRCRGTWPIAPGALNGVYVGNRHAQDALSALRPGGRLVAATALAVPPGVTELVRDAQHWVAERNDDASVRASVLTQLQRRR